MILNAFNRSVRALTAWISPKVLLVMKLTTAILLMFLVQVSAKSYSQITLNEQNASLEKVLNSIKKQTGYSFFLRCTRREKCQGDRTGFQCLT